MIIDFLHKCSDITQQFEQKYNQAPYLYALLAAMSSVFQMTIFKIIAMEGIPTYQIIFFRSLMLFSLNYMIMKGQKQQMYVQDGQGHQVLLKKQIVQIFTPLIVMYGYTLMLLSDASVLFLTNPIWIQIWSVILYKEEITRRQKFYTLLSFVGIMFIIRPESIFGKKDIQDQNAGNQIFGATLILIGGCSSGLSQSLTKSLQNKVNSGIMMQYFNITGIITGPILMIYNGNFNLDIFSIYIFIYLLAFVMLSYFKLTFQAKSYLLGNPAKLSPLNYTQVLFSYSIDIFIFHEDLQILSIIGASLIIYSCYQIVQSKAKNKK